MKNISFARVFKPGLLACSLAAITACGGSDSKREPVIPEVPEVPISIRGVLDNPINSSELPSGSLPSSSLPTYSLPAGTLPTVEIDESPTVDTLRTLNVVLQLQQEVSDSALIDEGMQLSAEAELAVDEVSGRVTATVTALNADAGEEVTMVHIHSGFAGENGGVLVGLQRSTDNPLRFDLDANISDFADIGGNDLDTFLDGGWYLNLHTTSIPSGHLRGQLFTNDIDVVRSELQGKQENPAVLNAEGVSGVGYVTLNADDGAVVANLAVEGFVPFLDAPIGPVHIHSGFAGENGAVILPLSPVGESDTSYRGTEADAIAAVDFDQIGNGGTYFNVHSAANGSGEVRGQIVPRGIDVVRTELQGQQENPAVVNAEGISGVAYVTINNDEQALVANASVEGFVPFLDAPIGPVHIHSGFAGENGGVLVPLSAVGDSMTDYRGTELDAINPIDFDVLAGGGTYVNVHSAENGSGELRGQIVPNGIDVVRAELEGQQENPAVVNADGVAGVGYVTINAEGQGVVANVSVEGFTPFLDAPIGPVHIHSGFAGENGGVLVPLSPVGDSMTDYRGTELDAINPVDFDVLADGGTYINVHSAENGMGELRGQIVPRGVDVARAELQGQQENPAVVNAAGVSGVGYVTVNAEDKAVVANVTVQGFVPFLDAPIGPVHIHSGFAGENGGVLLPLSPVDGSDTNYRGTDADAIADIDFEQLAKGGTYINVHSAENGGGEVRGQILQGSIDVVRTQLETSQEVPAVTTPSSADVGGVGYFTFDSENALFNPIANVSVTGFEATAVHVHRGGVAGVAGPVQIGLTDISDASAPGSSFSASGDGASIFSLDGLLAGAYYFNAHSAQNPNGEVRGQILVDNIRAFSTELNGLNVIPEINLTSATGVGFITVNQETESFSANVQVFDFAPLPSSVSLNVGGSNNTAFTELTAQGDGFFSATGQVFSLNGLLNGAYSLQADE